MGRGWVVLFALSLLLLLVAGLTGCDSFVFTPFGSESDKYDDLNAKNLSKIMSMDDGSIPFKVAFVADTHTYYEETEKIIKILNNRDDMDFIMIVGDITNQGLLQEYEWSVEVFRKSRYPFLVVIGNHDALTFGQDIFHTMFGSYNFKFRYKSVEFVCFNDNKWEFGAGVPDFRWLEDAVSEIISPLSVLACHIDPCDGAEGIFTPAEVERFESMIPSVFSLTVHGHWHGPRALVQGGVARHVVGSAGFGHCLIVTFYADYFEIEQCKFF